VAGKSSDYTMKIIETTVFSRQIAALLDDDSKQTLLDELVARPDAGDIIKGSGGLRKLRWSAHGRGKRGGIRVIYYWQVKQVMYLLLAYPKNKKDDLSDQELSVLKKVVQEEKKSWTRNSSKS
jgi:hypothetical protein